MGASEDAATFYFLSHICNSLTNWCQGHLQLMYEVSSIGVVHLQNRNSVIIYTLSCLFKPV